MMKSALAIFMVSFFLLRPYSLQQDGLWYGGDDCDYFAQASSLVFGQFPSYKNEYFTNLKEGPMGSVGPGIMAAPFVFIFSWLDRWENSSITQKRTEQNILHSWSQFGFVVSSNFYFCLACMLLYLACASFVEPITASWAVILMAICQGMPLYALRRPVFSHSAEFFLQSLMIYLLVRNLISKGQCLDRWYKYFFVGVLSAMIFLTRYNNIMMAVAWPLILLIQQPALKLRTIVFRLSWAFLGFIPLILFFKIWPENFNHYQPYSDAFNYISVQATGLDILKRIGHVFFGFDWGLIYTAPFLLLGVIALVFFEIPYKRALILAALPLWVNLYVVIFFGTQGGWYGYRYLIASAFPVFVIPLAVLIDKAKSRPIKYWPIFLILLALPSTLSMLFFEGNSSTLTLHLIPQFFGRHDWSNDSYQMAVWQTLISIPHLCQALFKGGLYYLINLFGGTALLLGKDKVTVLVHYYPSFEWKLLAKVFIIYTLPFWVLFIFRKGRFKIPTN